MEFDVRLADTSDPNAEETIPRRELRKRHQNKIDTVYKTHATCCDSSTIAYAPNMPA